jgi:calpain
MGCSRSNAGEMEVEIDGEKTGIIGGHAYGLMDAFEVPDENATN